MLKNSQTYFRSLALFTPQDFKVCLAIFQHYAWKSWFAELIYTCSSGLDQQSPSQGDLLMWYDLFCMTLIANPLSGKLASLLFWEPELSVSFSQVNLFKTFFKQYKLFANISYIQLATYLLV